MIVLTTLTTAGLDAGPFNLYSNVDGFVTAFATNVSKSALLDGYESLSVPDSTTVVRVKSIGVCTNYIDISVVPVPTTTTSSTTIAPSIVFSSARDCSFTTSGGQGSSCMGSGTFTITGKSFKIRAFASINSGPTPLTINDTDAVVDGYALNAIATSPYVSGYSSYITFTPGTYSFSYLVTGSGGSNTGGAGGLLYEEVP